MERSLRPDQSAAIGRLRQSLAAGHRRPLLQAPTGYGKTMVASAIVESALAKQKRIIFVVPALSLIDQTIGAFQSEGITEIGVIQGLHEMTNWDQPVQVCSVQTLMRRTAPPADVVLIDEAHRWFDFYGKWMFDEAWTKIPFVGLSATPWTRGLGRYYDDLIIAATTQQMIDQGHLSDFKVYAPAHPDLKGVRTVAGDYHEGDLANAVNTPMLVADTVDTWLQRAEGRPTFVFAVDRVHAKHLQKKFQEHGVSTDYVDAYTDRLEREAVRSRFHRGETKVVCNVGCLTTGVDWDVRCIVLARPTKSEMLFVQMIGRGLRTAPGKDFCLVLDHSDTHLRLGFVTDIHHGKLHQGRERVVAERGMALPKECPQCAFLKPPKVAKCPQCGFVATVINEIENEAGELEELKRAKSKAKPKATMAEKEIFYRGLLFIAQERQYKSGWAANQYKEKFKVWPNDFRSAIAMEPTQEVRNWVKSRMIAYAKAKAKTSNQPQASGGQYAPAAR